jgi:signal transduction histidine kinase
VRLPAAQAVGYQEVHRGGDPVIIDDVQSASPAARVYRESVLADRYAIFAYARSLLLVPLRVREHLIGMVRIESDQPHFYSERDAQLALAFANQAAAAIENARLYDQARDLATIEERQRLARELHDAVTQTLFSASLIAEALPDAWRQSPEKAQRGVEELRRLTRGALAEMRTLLLAAPGRAGREAARRAAGRTLHFGHQPYQDSDRARCRGRGTAGAGGPDRALSHLSGSAQ